MKTVVSKGGVEVLYPCSVHLLTNGAIVECEYKSDNNGRDLMEYICDYFNLEEKDYWGLRYVDVYDQRYWLDLKKLIRPQVKNSCPMHFHFRVKVYPPEPYKLGDEEAKYQIFMQLRFDLMSGRLGCGPSDSAMLIGLILQYTYGDYDPSVHFGNYVQEKILLNQTFNIEMKSIDTHKNHLKGLSIDQAQDLFLRMASQLDTYGVDPYLVEDVYGDKLTLWINYRGMATYNQGKEVHRFEWMCIADIRQEENKIELLLVSEDAAIFYCFTKGECDYIFQGAYSHYKYFTTLGVQSTLGQIDNESCEDDTFIEDVEKFETGSESEGQNEGFLNKCSETKLPILNEFYNFFYTIRYILIILVFSGLVKLFYFCNVNMLEKLGKFTVVQNHITLWS